MRATTAMSVTNNGTTPFVWGSYQVTMEYLSAVTQQWIPIAKTLFDAQGVQTDAPPLLHLNYGDGNLIGTTIAPGQTVGLDGTDNLTLPGDLINLLGDPAEASAVRVEIHIDTGGGTPGIVAENDITPSFFDGQTTSNDVGGVIVQFTEVPLQLTADVTTIPPGASETLTGTTVMHPLDPKQPGESDYLYLRRLPGNVYEAKLYPNVDAWGRTSVTLLNPILNIQKTGPAQGLAGYTLPYAVQLQNVGTAVAATG